MIKIDGSYGEGGGQIVRTALALSVLTQQPFQVTGIRAGRKKPGLKAQHLTAIKAWQQICRARTSPYDLGTTELTFQPNSIIPGRYEVDIGTAGSISLVQQALLLPLMFGSEASELTFFGGSCGKWQSPVEYTQHVLLPYLKKIVDCQLKIEKRGYYPKGGGRVKVHLNPIFERWTKAATLSPFDLTQKGKLLRIEGISHAAIQLKNAEVAERQCLSAQQMLQSLDCPVDIEVTYGKTRNPGSGLTLWAVYDQGLQPYPQIHGADEIGEKGIKAEEVGRRAASLLLQEIHGTAIVDEFLSDQLIPFLALIPGSQMQVHFVSDHLKSNMYVVEAFLPVKFLIENRVVRVERG